MPQVIPEDPPKKTSINPLNVAWAALGGLCIAVVLPIRTDLGKNALRVNGLMAIVVMYLWTVFYPCIETFYYGMFWLLCAMFKRGNAVRQHYFGTRQVTYYEGLPTLAFKAVPFVGERVAKILVEPLILLLVAMVLSPFTMGLSHFFMLGAVALPFREMVMLAIQSAGDDAAGDAEIMMQQRAERMRRKRGR